MHGRTNEGAAPAGDRLRSASKCGLGGRNALNLLGALCLALFVTSVPSRAASTTVTSANDSGPGTLRAAVAFANTNAEETSITFDAALSGQSIILTNGGIWLSNTVAIDASALTNGILISGNASSRIFQITAAGVVTLNSLILASGSISNDRGGAILNSGQLMALNCLFTNNTARGGTGQTPGSSSNGGPGGGGAGMGGAVFSDGVALLLTNCVFSGNQAVGGPGGAGNGNSGINQAGGDGGGPNRGQGGAIGQAGGAGGYGGGGGGGAGSFNGGYAGGSGGFGGGGGGGGAHGAGYDGGVGGAGGPYGGNGGDAHWSVSGGGGGGAGLGGAVFAKTGAVTVVSCSFSNNTAANGVGGLGSYGAGNGTNGQAVGGALFSAVSLLMSNNVFSGNAASNAAPNIQAPNVVTSLADSGPGTLRAALAAAGDGYVVDATGVSGTITLTSSQLNVTSSVTVRGPGATNLTVSGNNAFRVFNVTGTNVTICGLTIANGYANANGGGIQASGAGNSLMLANCVVSNNNASVGGYRYGGGIFNPGATLTVSNSLVCGNSAYEGGGLFNQGTLAVVASTISGNSASYGGGIYNSAYSGSATLTVSASTLSGNSGIINSGYGEGGGIYNDGYGGTATVTVNISTLSSNAASYAGGGGLYNSGDGGNAVVTVNASTFSSNSTYGGGGGCIFNDGRAGGSATVQVGDTILNGGPAAAGNLFNTSGTISSAGYNLSSDAGAGFLNQLGDQTNTDPMLGPLQDNGGPTWTHALLTGSPAIDQGNRNAIPALASATDQRGQPRISDWPGVDKASDGSDIGAFEAQYVSPYSPYSGAYTFTTVAGRSSMGSADGVGSDAQFYQPVGVTMDRAGNLYVADSWDNVIRKITPAGVVTTIAGFAGSSGSADGTNSAARFNEPRGIAVDRAGNLYVADYYNYTIRKITPAGAVSTIAGLAGSYGSADGTNDTAQFSFPQGVAVDRAGNVYVADAGNCTIREITPAGTNWVVITIAGRVGWSGSADGLGTNAQFGGGYSMSVEGSMALAMDGATNLYVADTYNHTIRKLTPLGTNWMVSTIAGQPPQWMDFGGYADGTNGDARFYLPSGIVVDATTNLFVADCQNNALRRITPVGTNWVTGTLAGWPGPGGMADGTGTNAQFNAPEGVAVDTSAGTVFVADMYNNLIREITSAGVVTTLAGATSRGSADGAPQTARFNWPYGVAVGSSGNVYVADTYNHTIRKITSAGLVSTIAGLSGQSGSADGAGSNARFNGPGAVAVDAAGNLYVADMWNYTIRKITPAGMVSTIAGLAGQYGSDDGTNSAARFWGPLAITADSATNLYVADGDNTIRKITPVGANWVVKTIAGSALSSGQGSADGTNGAAQFNTPIGVAVDTAGRVYVADIYNYTIRQITPVGPNWVVTTIAGSAGHYGSADGTGANASFTQPYGIAVDRAGNLYVTAFYTIRKITPVGTDWVVSTIGGLNGSPGAADGAGSAARFYNACGIALDAAGNLYIADTDNNTIRKGVLTAYGTANLQAYAQPPMSGQLVVTLLPPEANGQWRFPWELAWRNSGDTAGNLVPGNYTVECRNAPGWLAIPLPAFPIPGGATTFVTNQYYPTSNFLGTTNTGSLTVNIGPTVPGGAGWRFLGEGAWRPPGSTAANLLPDTYAIEFEPVSGYSKPASQAVQVSAGTTTAILASYLLAQSAPSGVCLPAPVPTNSINDLADYPYGFNGQLQSDLGYGSGVAVQTNVVLTAAHLVFNDQTLSYVSQVYWWFRQEANVFMPQPQAARGWYLLSGYAAQRTNDLLGGFAPEQSSPQSRNLDAAALYFPSPVAGGGCGGYLSSDATPNSWLTSISQKLLVGYPVDGSSLGDASILPGTMYQTGPQPYPLSLATDPVSDQQVYLAQWFLSYPGNSGGPFYVQYNGYYYPAGVYLGTLYNGVVPYASLVRGIDSNVVNLITSAQLLGDSGTNYTGGGVITITAGGSAGQLAYVQVDIEPAAAVAAGAAWRLQGAGTWNPTTPFTITVAPGSPATIEFQQIPGWAQPSSSSQQVTAGQLTTISATYTVIPAQLGVSPTSGFAASGFAGGPFNPSSTTYTLTNSGGASLNWSASKSAAWLSLSASNGTLAAGAKTNVTVSLNANANSLIASNYSAVVGFTNLTGGRGNTNRAVSLNVLVHPSVLLTNLQVLANGSLAMRLQGVTNRVYSILGTTNLLQPLTNWLEVLRLTNTAGQTTFTNPLPSTTPQYYRANEL